MNDYTAASQAASAAITKHYSTSFGLSILLFPKLLRPHIYALYGLVRVADEIVDTYRGDDAKERLRQLEDEVGRGLETGYSVSPIVHAFIITARAYGIDGKLIKPFFKSMRMDLSPQVYDQESYQSYIYGSAEVVGLMSLKIYGSDTTEDLAGAAQRLGAAYQKVNFLRDIAADNAIDRWYFPNCTYDSFSEKDKSAILKDITADFDAAAPAIDRLPKRAQKAVRLSYLYYQKLLKKISRTPAERLKTRRIRVADPTKFALLVWVTLGGR